jgi:hypothetical protein
LSTFRFRDIVTNNETGTPLFVPREELEITLQEGGALSFALDPNFIEVIDSALDAAADMEFAAQFAEPESEEDVRACVGGCSCVFVW